MKKSALLRFLILISIIPLMTNCGIFHSMQSKPSVTKGSAENFDSFYDKFHADSAFQMSRIMFPINGLKVDSNGAKQWSVENWTVLKTKIYDVDRTQFKTEFSRTEERFIQKFWVENSGYSAEYHFELVGKKWFLVYARDTNL